MVFTGTVRRPRFPPRRVATVAVIVALVAAAALTAAVFLGQRSDLSVHASSSAGGSDLTALATGGRGSTHWQSVDQTTGAWLQANWPSPRRVNRVELAADGRRSFSGARMTFSDGSSLLVTPDSTGKVDLSFPARVVNTARITFTDAPAGRSSIALSEFRVSDSGRPVPVGDVAGLRATASSTAPGHSTSQLVDGDPAAGDLGGEWLADPSRASAQARLRWSGPREVVAVRLWGPTAPAYDPAYSAAAAINGRLRFSDGSSVRLSGLSGGAGQPTTIAFTPRVVESITVVLEKTIPQAALGLRGLQIFDATSTPRTPSASVAPLGDSTPAAADADGCSAATTPVGRPAINVIALVCPAVDASIAGNSTIVVATAAGTAVSASTVLDPRDPTSISLIASATAGPNGRAVLSFDAQRLPHGPIGVEVRPTTVTTTRALDVQLYNTGGVPSAAAGPGHERASLVWDDEFDRAPVISDSGTDAVYGARKPEYWGGAQFGDATFDSPGSPASTFQWVDHDYLRIRAQALGSGPDPAAAGNKYLGGLLSSLHVGATGFAAQYGYYEIRMLAPASNGTWPAFWAMNTDAATKASEQSSAEADAVELYGNRPTQTCHSVHSYTGKKDQGSTQCIDGAASENWSAGWHTYGMQIEPGQVEFFVDGKHVRTDIGLSHTDQPFYFMANLALGGGWPVDLTPTGDAADLWIDYIRVYV